MQLFILKPNMTLILLSGCSLDMLPNQSGNRTWPAAHFGLLYSDYYLLWAGWFILEELLWPFSTICIFNIRVHNLVSFQKFQCLLQLVSIYWVVYSSLPSIPLTFIIKKAIWMKRVASRILPAGLLSKFFRSSWKVITIPWVSKNLAIL